MANQHTNFTVWNAVQRISYRCRNRYYPPFFEDRTMFCCQFWWDFLMYMLKNNVIVPWWQCAGETFYVWHHCFRIWFLVCLRSEWILHSKISRMVVGFARLRMYSFEVIRSHFVIVCSDQVVVVIITVHVRDSPLLLLSGWHEVKYIASVLYTMRKIIVRREKWSHPWRTVAGIWGYKVSLHKRHGMVSSRKKNCRHLTHVCAMWLQWPTLDQPISRYPLQKSEHNQNKSEFFVVPILKLEMVGWSLHEMQANFHTVVLPTGITVIKVTSMGMGDGLAIPNLHMPVAWCNRATNSLN